jgi:hypothetical protein
MCRLGAARFYKPNGVLDLVSRSSRPLPSQPRLGQHRKANFEGVMTSAKPWLQLGNLPIDSTSFVGRRRELSEARRLLGDAQLLTLTGVGGVGKTRLALRLAADVRRTFPDGVWLADLAELRDGELVPQTVIAALGLRDDFHAPARRHVVGVSGGQAVVVVGVGQLRASARCVRGRSHQAAQPRGGFADPRHEPEHSWLAVAERTTEDG